MTRPAWRYKPSQPWPGPDTAEEGVRYHIDKDGARTYVVWEMNGMLNDGSGRRASGVPMLPETAEQVAEHVRAERAAVVQGEAEQLRAQEEELKRKHDSELLQLQLQRQQKEGEAAQLGAPGTSTVITLYIDGDQPSFDEHRFKKALAGNLLANIAPRQIEIKPIKRKSARAARINAGSCTIEAYVSEDGYLKYVTDSSSDSSSEEEVDSDIQEAIITTVRRWWPKEVGEMTTVDVRYSSVILTLRLELPVALILFQLVQQRHAALADLRVRCCLLDGKVARLDDRDDIESCEQKLLRPEGSLAELDEKLAPQPQPQLDEVPKSVYKPRVGASTSSAATGRASPTRHAHAGASPKSP